MIAGKWTITDGQIPGLDIDHLIHTHSSAAKRLQEIPVI
jgi:8-oxoguanine deaminase